MQIWQLFIDLIQPVTFILISREPLSEYNRLTALYLSGTYCNKTGTRPPMPQELTIFSCLTTSHFWSHLVIKEYKASGYTVKWAIIRYQWVISKYSNFLKLRWAWKKIPTLINWVFFIPSSFKFGLVQALAWVQAQVRLLIRT